MAADTSMLTERGHEVCSWLVDNREIAHWPLQKRAALLWRTTWSTESYRRLGVLVGSFNPDVVHFHNTLPIISPSAIVAAHRLRLPVVMTLHNYRLLCPVGTFTRNGKVCEECRTGSLLRSILHRCYRGSAVQTATISTMLGTHRRMGTWRECVAAYIVLSEFMRGKMIEGGLPVDKLHVRSTPINTPEPRLDAAGDYVQFIGRLSEEKGVEILLELSKRLERGTLRVAGTGPLRARVAQAASSSRGGLEYLGELEHSSVLQYLSHAKVLVFPSISYEGFGLVVLEAMSLGIPIVASRISALPEMVSDGVEGFLVEPNDVSSLALRVNQLLADDGLRRKMGAAARKRFSKHYSIDSSYSRLMEIYESAIRSAGGVGHSR